ncbi:MAG: hypothetical protein M0R77_00285 [Gammaproteobacteria bacterium]|nr:hypothetical protein [Acholeplasmataceae bacterium]MCK9528992.1 hypothetical protein [Gammaproteobacteria bacterium]
MEAIKKSKYILASYCQDMKVGQKKPIIFDTDKGEYIYIEDVGYVLKKEVECGIINYVFLYHMEKHRQRFKVKVVGNGENKRTIAVRTKNKAWFIKLYKIPAELINDRKVVQYPRHFIIY